VLILRSTIFNLLFFAITPVFSVLVLAFRPFGFRAAWLWARAWSRATLFLLRWICGIRLVVEGREHLPDTPCVVMAKHQTALETIAMPVLVPPFVWVLKRELFRIPIFGWALRALNEIAISRTSPRQALKQVLEQGKRFLRQERWVVIFPEGERMPPGQTGEYQASGVVLAHQAGVGILPLAHNAGVVWPKRSFIKRPGTVTFRFLPFIPAEDVRRTPRTVLLERLKNDIESATRATGG